MIIELSIDLTEEKIEENIEEFEEELMKRVDEIKEDLSIRVYLNAKIDYNEYRSYEIEYYLDDEEDVELAINKVIVEVENKLSKLSS